MSNIRHGFKTPGFLWFLDKSHKRPALGQSVVSGNLRFTITEHERNTIRRLKLDFLKQENSG